MKITDEDIQAIILSSSGDFLFHIGESLEFHHYDGLMPQEEQDRLYKTLQIWIKKSAGEFKQIQEG
ncbi:hypothetical protein LLY23_04395 [Morganella morganii]|jgi:hypothetical protein|uniref:hypothetical protein n=1 Tax=Morganella morganii TaxID=582 RepID=UPI001E52CD5A|nr:hypothetical protein [Morganella morganii]UEH04759.1 hypothetical protein LLY23_04395 [Morganella morganii]HED3889365.1 hypothetical protein [Morganella morganii]HED3890496.1 hypothetical protein [Morganella morganii]